MSLHSFPKALETAAPSDRDVSTPSVPVAPISRNPNTGESDAKSADVSAENLEYHLIVGRRQEHLLRLGSFGPAPFHDETPCESAAEEISHPFWRSA
jgi:hypothetical protein